jgi:hypothetical protein
MATTLKESVEEQQHQPTLDTMKKKSEVSHSFDCQVEI